MFAHIGTLTVLLTVLWFFVYWIFGGVVFSIISLVRPGKMKRVRFSCLYTLLSLVCATIAAHLGTLWATQATGSVPQASTVSEAVVVIGGLGFAGILLGLLIGFVLSFVGGWIVMAVSRSKESTWYERMQRPHEGER